LTGGAYLHIGSHLPESFCNQAKQALALFGSTSPSYIILKSLDMANAVLASKKYLTALAKTVNLVEVCRRRLEAKGLYSLNRDDPLKLTLCPHSYGYTGEELADYLRNGGIECEFADPDYLVIMVTPAITDKDMARLTERFADLPRRDALQMRHPASVRPVRAMTIREAALSPSETLPVRDCVGRILAAATVGCPPAVPIVACGEVIDQDCLACFAYYGIETCSVVKNNPS
jgi:arginine/lysine/ornithine decarboxylase